MQLKSWVRGLYECTQAVSIVFAIMAVAAIFGGCVLVAEGPHQFSRSNLYRYETTYFAMGVGLIILGILFLVWSATMMGCTICLNRVHTDEPDGQQSEWNTLLGRSRICTMIACILLALAGVAIVLTGCYFVVENPLPFVNYGYPSCPNYTYYQKAAMNYVGGLMLIVLAVIFFIWTAILTVCAICLRKAINSKMSEPQSNDPPPYKLHA